jgi:hypothetical protein
MTQTGINLQRVQILETDIYIPKPCLETLVTAAGGRGQDQANSKDNKKPFFRIFLIKILSFRMLFKPEANLFYSIWMTCISCKYRVFQKNL